MCLCFQSKEIHRAFRSGMAVGGLFCIIRSKVKQACKLPTAERLLHRGRAPGYRQRGVSLTDSWVSQAAKWEREDNFFFPSVVLELTGWLEKLYEDKERTNFGV